MIKLLTILIAFTTLSTIAVDKKDWEEIHGLSQLTEKDREEAQKKIVSSENDFKTLVKTAEKTNLALRAIIKIGTINLRKKGTKTFNATINKRMKQPNAGHSVASSWCCNVLVPFFLKLICKKPFE